MPSTTGIVGSLTSNSPAKGPESIAELPFAEGQSYIVPLLARRGFAGDPGGCI
jgi:hypothetical protein